MTSSHDVHGEDDMIAFLRAIDRVGLTVADLATALERRREQREWLTGCDMGPHEDCGWRAGPSRDADGLHAAAEQHMRDAHPGVEYTSTGVVDTAVWDGRPPLLSYLDGNATTADREDPTDAWPANRHRPGAPLHPPTLDPPR